jgi:hypothetical protein
MARTEKYLVVASLIGRITLQYNENLIFLTKLCYDGFPVNGKGVSPGKRISGGYHVKKGGHKKDLNLP